MSLTKKNKIIIASITAAVLVAIILSVSLSLFFVFSSKGPFHGSVVDNEGNAIENVMVTDGRNVVKTDKDGKFTLDGYHDSTFVTVTLPSGYNADDFYIPVMKNRKTYNFVLNKIDADYSNGHTFLQVTDSEIGAGGVGEWVNHIKSVVDETNPAFIIHTGDICYEDGLEAHIRGMNSQNMGVPVRYVIGNHDYVDVGNYGEELFESIYGPVWYSFDVGNVHYVVTPFQVGGDFPSGYNKNDRWKWLENDLKHVSPDKKVVVFNHTTPPSDDYVIKYDSKTLDLKEKNLIAWVFGHYHYNYINEASNGALNISTGRPDAGGIDSSLSGTRQINISSEGTVSTKMHYYDFTEPTVATGDIAGAKWTNDELAGNVLFADTLVEGDSVYVATTDDDYPRECGVYSINALTGETNWFYKTNNSVKNNIVYSGGMIVAQDADGMAYCINAETGVEVWKKKVGLGNSLGTSSGIVADNGIVYLGCASEITAIKIADGSQVWNVRRGKGENSPSEFVIVGDTLLVGSHWDALVALNKNTGKKQWERVDENLRFRTSTPVAIDNNTILVADDDVIMTVDLKNGKILSKSSFKDKDGKSYHFSSSSKPYIKNGIAYIATKNSGIVAYDIATKSLKWNFKTRKSLIYTAPYSGGNDCGVESSFIELDGALVFGANDGYVYKLNMTTGELINEINVGAPIFGKAGIHDGKVIVSDFSGRVIKLEI